MSARRHRRWAALGQAGLLVLAASAMAAEPWHDRPQGLALAAEGPRAGSGWESGPAAGGLGRTDSDRRGRGVVLADEGQGLVWQIGKTAVALAAVCALLYVFVRYGLRRLAGSGREAEGLFRVVARFGLEPKKMLYVVEVSGKTVLLGSSETGVRFLAELDGGPIRRAAEAGPAQPRLTGPGPGGAFYQLLQRKLDRPAMERPGVESRPAAPGAIREDVS